MRHTHRCGACGKSIDCNCALSSKRPNVWAMRCKDCLVSTKTILLPASKTDGRKKYMTIIKKQRESMTQDELNKELDHFLEEGIFNGDLDGRDTELIRHYVCAMVRDVHGINVTDEQWQLYAAHCLQTSVENSTHKKINRVQ